MNCYNRPVYIAVGSSKCYKSTYIKHDQLLSFSPVLQYSVSVSYAVMHNKAVTVGMWWDMN